jgi:hypothetical protein
MTRNEVLLEGLNKETAKIIELGPSFAPVAAKREGWKTTIVDHTDEAGLLAKYSAFESLDLSGVEPVDVIWEGESLHDNFAQEERGSFDAIIASHVIEHIVDPISFLNSAAVLLRPSGKVILAVPDKRLCFDCLRPVSSTGQVIAAFEAKRKLHSYAAVFDALAYDTRPPDGAPSWAKGTAFPPRFNGALDGPMGLLKGYDEAAGSSYLDVHGWVFTPASFALIMLELHALKYIDWHVAKIVEQEAVEFIAILEHIGELKMPSDALAALRMQLLIKQLEEARDHANWLFGRSDA